MVGDWTHGPMWVLFVLLLAGGAIAMCPFRCTCDEDTLRTICASASLEVVPIQLNPEVRHIDLSGNKINNLHFTLTIYSNLISLDISDNKIESIGSKNFEVQHRLKYLNLSNNEIENLSRDAFNGLRALHDLDLSNNRIEDISPHAFGDLHSLMVLRLTGNRIDYLEDGLLKPATMLKDLFLEDNQLLELPTAAISDAINLERLFLSRNLIAAIRDNEIPVLSELQVLQLDSNLINEINHGALGGLSSLEHLDLSDNNFTVVPTVALAKLSNLTKLKFSGNFINMVPPVAFRGLFQLRHLRLDRLEFLKRIDPRAFVDNINLEKVWLDDNIEVKSLPNRLFYGNPHVTAISIRNNQLSSLDASHFPLDQLRWLKLGGNQLQCNCSLLWLWKLGQEQKHRRITNDSNSNDLSIDIEDIQCTGPEPLANMKLVDTTESQVGCSLGWIATICTILITSLVVTGVIGLLYCSPLKRKLKKRDLPAIENMPPIQNGVVINYATDSREKYIIGPPLIHEYSALPPWDNYKDAYGAKECNGDVYKQFDTFKRPHIVYV